MFTTEKIDGVTVVVVNGDLLGTKSLKAKETLLALIGEGARNIVVDLSAVVFVDSSGLGALVSALKTLRASGGDLRVCGAVAQVVTIFELTRLTKLIRIFPDRQSAAESFRESD
jgi:anti-sigma B factor antagonist